MWGSIESYVDRFVRFPEITRLDAATLDEFKRCSEVVVVGYTGSGDFTVSARFEALAKALHPEVVFGVIDDAENPLEEDISASVMVIYNNGADERSLLPIIEDHEEMKASIRSAALPLVVDLYHETHGDLLDVRHNLSHIHFKDSA